MDIRILLADDEEDILNIFSHILKKEGFIVFTTNNGIDALNISKKELPHFILLDYMMPGLNGYEVCKKLRTFERFNDTVITFLTAKNDDITQINCLEVGADDFISKQVSTNVIISKIKAHLRNKYLINYDEDIRTFDEFQIFIKNKKVKMKGKDINLTSKEFKILELLTSNPDKIYSKEEIIQNIWEDKVYVGDRTIDVHVRHLRQKLKQNIIGNKKGIGYYFALKNK